MKDRKKETTRFLSLVLLAAFSLVNCNKQKDTAVLNGNEVTKLRVNISTASPSNIVNYIALDQGYFDAEGLDVVSTPLASGANIDTITALLTGKLDLNVSGGSAIGTLLSLELDQDVIVIGGALSSPGALMIRPGDESRWQQLNDANLTGRKIGTKRTGTSDIAFRGTLVEHEVDLSKLTFVEFDSYPSAIIACAKGEVDAAVITHSSLLNAEQQGLTVFKYIGEWLPDFPCCRMLTTSELLKKYRSQYVGYIKSYIKAYKTYKTNPAKTVEIGVKYFNQDEDRLSKLYYGYGQEYGYDSKHPDPAKKRLQNFYNIAAKIGYLKGGADLNPHFDTSLYEEALDQVIKEFPNDPFYLEMKQVFIRDNV
jgi:NitT/TauT family transport system substrate-binding protein